MVNGRSLPITAVKLEIQNNFIMSFILLGVVVLITSLFLKSNFQYRRYTGVVRGIGALLIIIGVLISTIVQINAGEVGVKTLFGKVQKDVLGSGLHMINPLMEVIHLDIKTQNYTMSGAHDESAVTADDAIRVLTADGLEVTIDLTVLFRLNSGDAPRIIRETGANYVDKIVRPVTRTKIRDNAVYYEAVSLYSTKRDEFQDRIFKTIETNFKERGLFLEQLLVRNITLPQSVKSTIEGKINAEQEAQKMQYVLQKEEQEAERKRVEAQGIADYQRIINTGLTDKQLQYEQIKANLKLAESQNAKVIIMGRGNTPVILDAKN